MMVWLVDYSKIPTPNVSHALQLWQNCVCLTAGNLWVRFSFSVLYLCMFDRQSWDLGSWPQDLQQEYLPWLMMSSVMAYIMLTSRPKCNPQNICSACYHLVEPYCGSLHLERPPSYKQKMRNKLMCNALLGQA